MSPQFIAAVYLNIMNKKLVHFPVSKKLLLSSCFLVIPASMTPTVYAFDVPAAESTTQSNSNYPAEFFSQYQPQNAFEMIERLPGFSFDRGDNGRGFGGNAGNVLIDGARPTSKSGGLSGALSRIPADQVERIEILRGGVSAGDAAGQSVVANVIKRKNITSGTYALKARRAPYGNLEPNVEAAISTNIGQWDAAFDIDVGYGPGYRQAVINKFDKNNTLESSASEIKERLGRFSFANGQMSRKFGDAKLTLNGRVGADKSDNKQDRNVYNNKLADDSTPDSQWALREISRFETAEFGVDWVDTFGDWKWHSLILGQVEQRSYGNNANSSVNNVISDTSQFSQDRYNSEYIIRNTYGFVGNAKFKPEFGIEAAKNYLDTSLEYISNGAAQSLDNANVQVEEIRAELFASFVYSYSDKLSIDGGLTAEFSQIEVSGNNAKKQNLDFLKPRISANYKYNKDINFVVEAQHIVGQLNFNHFAASNSTEDDRNVSGNSDLQPERTNELSATFDWSFSEKGSLKSKLSHQWIDDVLEEIELPSGGQGLGNAGAAKIWGIDTQINIPTAGFLDNGLLEVSYNYISSDFNDVIIHRSRNISDYNPRDFVMKFRQDLTDSKIAWGINYYDKFERIDYLVDTIVSFKGNRRLQAFIETTYFDDYKIQLEVSNMNVGKFTRTREFYADNRSGSYDGMEVSNRRREPEYKLSIWGTF